MIKINMNDLELEGATQQAAEHVEKDTEQRTGKDEAEQEEDDFLDPRCVRRVIESSPPHV